MPGPSVAEPAFVGGLSSRSSATGLAVCVPSADGLFCDPFITESALCGTSEGGFFSGPFMTESAFCVLSM